MAYTVIHGKLVKTHSTQGHLKYRHPGIRNDANPRDKPDKGDKGGRCNITRCQRPGASWFNHSTRRYYCADCAWFLNTDKFNKRDAQELYGHELCTEEKS